MTDEIRSQNLMNKIKNMPQGSCVIYRHYDDPHRVLLGKIIAKLCREKRLYFIVAGDFSLAIKLNAGFHIPEYQLRWIRPSVRLWHQKNGHLLTAATHSLRSIKLAQNMNVDACLLSPIFTTESHPNRKCFGWQHFRTIVKQSKQSIFGLGGLKPKDLPVLNKFGSFGLASIRMEN
jgi:thiamine-phosphate pyrophosphorylase